MDYFLAGEDQPQTNLPTVQPELAVNTNLASLASAKLPSFGRYSYVTLTTLLTFIPHAALQSHFFY